MIRFQLRNGDELPGCLMRREYEHSYDYDYTLICPGGWYVYGCSVLIGYLQLEVYVAMDDLSGRVMYPWGYFPLERVEVADINVPQCSGGELIAHPSHPFEPGISEDVPGAWSFRRSRDQSVVLLRNELHDGYDDVARIASGFVVATKGNDLSRVWLEPDKVEMIEPEG
jgi:hypothetical protein